MRLQYTPIYMRANQAHTFLHASTTAPFHPTTPARAHHTRISNRLVHHYTDAVEKQQHNQRTIRTAAVAHPNSN